MDSSARQTKRGLGWVEWFKGWYDLVFETLFEKIMARHLQNPLPLPPLTGVTCIVTGSTSGIGLEIARQLAESGAHVVMAVRDTQKAHELIQKWRGDNMFDAKKKALDIDVMELNLLSLESVVKFSEEWNSKSMPLNALVNNAGVFSMKKGMKFSSDGYEIHMQVNFLAPSLLSLLLLPSLKRGAPSRIVNVNSLMHAIGFIDAQDMNFETSRNKFTSLRGYSTSKLAQVMFSNVLHRTIPSTSRINVVCVDPGSVRTNVARDLPRIMQIGFRVLPINLFTAQEGSRSALYAATYNELLEYCEKLKAEDHPVCAYVACNCKTMIPSKEAQNLQTSQLVWEKTLDMIGVPSDVVESLLEGKEIRCRYGPI